jgi:ribulose-phosphate 3-epimerase
LPFDVHLIIERPEKYISQFIEAGADIITVHVEACKHLHRVVTAIKERGIKAGVSLNPATPPVVLEEIIPYVDLVLVMTVNPGFGGQVFIPGMLPKVACLRRMIDGRESKVELEVDGGVTADNAPDIVKAGANILVAGSAIFGDERGAREALRKLRGSLL